LIALALSSGIGIESWERAGPKAQATAWELLENAHDERRGG
jgi:hypothetical protein